MQVGTLIVSLIPNPVWPTLPRPQANTLPCLLITMVCSPPHATCYSNSLPESSGKSVINGRRLACLFLTQLNILATLQDAANSSGGHRCLAQNACNRMSMGMNKFATPCLRSMLPSFCPLYFIPELKMNRTRPKLHGPI